MSRRRKTNDEAMVLQANPGSLSGAAPNSKTQGAVLPMWAPHQVNPLLLQQQQFFQAFQVQILTAKIILQGTDP